MATGKTRSAATDEELSKLFEGIDDDGTATLDKTKAIPAASKGPVETAAQSEHDILAELGNLAERPASRTHTPKPQSAKLPAHGPSVSPLDSVDGTISARDSSGVETNPEKAADGSISQSISNASAPAHGTEITGQKSSPSGTSSAGHGWWGGLVATASAAVKTAEAAVKEIQQNEEAKRWTQQVKGNVGALKGIGDEIRSRALPTFTNLLHTLAPPISAHERLQIHITHDFVGYPSLDHLIYQTFSRVMAQVEGGDLLVIQRGQESSPRRSSEIGATFSGSGWTDGPWWRQSSDPRSLGIVKGNVEGMKLVKASVEGFASEFYAPLGGVEEASKKAIANMTESNPVRNSHIFIAIQAIGMASTNASATDPRQDVEGEASADTKADADELVAFAIYLYDPEHSIDFKMVTQSFPQKWADWMDASPTNQVLSPDSSSIPSGEKGDGLLGRASQDGGPSDTRLRPEEIAEIMRQGGSDPREWVAEWIEEVLSLGTGIVAQRYVSRRMGVGEGAIGHGKAPQQALDSGGGEAARAI